MILLRKIKKILKGSALWIKWIFGIIAGMVMVVFVSNRFSHIGKVGIKKKWRPVPGSDTEVFMKDINDKWILVQLPINPRTTTRLKTKEIENIGLSHTIGREVKIEIKHNITNRRTSNNTDSDMSM